MNTHQHLNRTPDVLRVEKFAPRTTSSDSRFPQIRNPCSKAGYRLLVPPLLAFGLLLCNTASATGSNQTAATLKSINLPLVPGPRIPFIPLPSRHTLDAAFCDITQHPPGEPSGGIEFSGPNAGNPGNGEIRQWMPGNGRPLIAFSLNNHPEAHCNDGTPARMYVRPAPPVFNGQSNPHIDKWQIHLKGGGGCTDFRKCAERWCDASVLNPVTGALTPRLLNDPGLMSSSGMPNWATAHGLFFDHPLNRFSAYNQVLVAYCSSDSWLGNHDSTQVRSTNPLDDGKRAIIEFRGKPIVDAVFDELSAPGGLSFTTFIPDSDQRIRVNLPSLSDAAQLLMTGDSAGANGVRHHIDRIQNELLALSAPQKPLVIAALDAGGTPKLDDLSIDWTAHPTATDYTDFMLDNFDQSVAFHGVAADAVDDSCVTFNGFNHPCVDATFVEQNHITTDLIQRTSLRDVLARKALVDSGMLPNEAALQDLSRIGLGDLTLAGTEARNPISVVGPDSTQHVTFRGMPYYTLTTATGLSTARHLSNWVIQCELGSCNVGIGFINDVD